MTEIIKAIDMGPQFLKHRGNHEIHLEWHLTQINFTA